MKLLNIFMISYILPYISVLYEFMAITTFEMKLKYSHVVILLFKFIGYMSVRFSVINKSRNQVIAG